MTARTGTIKWFNNAKGSGFISPVSGGGFICAFPGYSSGRRPLAVLVAIPMLAGRRAPTAAAALAAGPGAAAI